MLTRLIVRNFKRFEEIDIELGNPVVLIGPNNSGKTTVLQALSLWEIGLRRWLERRGGKEAPKKRSGVTVSRRDLIAVPVPDANLLWRDLHVRDVQRVHGKPETKNVRIEIIVEGITDDHAWRCGLEFDYANKESFYCRPLQGEGEERAVASIAEQARRQRMAFLPPMSGLAATEPKWEPGRVNVLIGEGQTAQVLRNLCQTILDKSGDDWKAVCEHVDSVFGVEIDEPQYVAERGEITLTYREHATRLDISASGRGLQQTLLLLAYLYGNPNSVLLIDEPDAHLEILRQRQIYQLLTQVAEEKGSQIIAASHSEVVLNEAAERHVVIAFVGKPHRIGDRRGSQVLKALKEIGFDQYYQAEQTGWVLYLEGSTDLAILQAFARVKRHPALEHLEHPFVHYVANLPAKAQAHFFGLLEAKRDLVGIAVYDRLDRELGPASPLVETMWKRSEIENYLCYPEVLLRYAEESLQGDLFARSEGLQRKRVMEECIKDMVPPVALRDKDFAWWKDVKATDGFLDPLLDVYFRKLSLPNTMRKSSYRVLAGLVPEEMLDPEVVEKLDMIVDVATRAKPSLE